MATSSPSSTKPPSYVFSYLPVPTAAPIASDATPTSPKPSFLSQTTTLLKSAFEDSFRTPRTAEDQRLESLQQVKAGMEAHIALKVKAGVRVEETEREGLKKVEVAMGGLQKEVALSRAGL